MVNGMIYFLSDAHLGSLAIERGWAHQKKLIDLLEEMSKDAVSIYMLGDMFDFWMEYFIHDKSKRQFHPFCKELRKLAKKGIHVHMFIGNHDLWTFGGLAQLTGAEIHYEPCTIIRYGKAIYLAHGDGLLPENWEKLYPKEIKKKIKRFIKLREIFRSPSLQMVTFTITEKGYLLRNAAGVSMPGVEDDFAAGPVLPKSYIGKVVTLLHERYVNGELPIAMVSMDNCSHNGDKLPL